MTNEKSITIADLHPELSPEQQQEALQNFQDYLALIKRIYDRLKAEGKLEEVLLRSPED